MSLFILGLVEIAILFAAIWGGVHIRYNLAELTVPTFSTYLVEVITFVLIVYLVLLATGLYHLDACRDLRITLVRLAASLVLSFLALSILLYTIPSIDLWRSVIFYSLILSFTGIFLNRFIFMHIVDLRALKRRVLVLGAGGRAEIVRKSGLDGSNDVDFILFLKVDKNEDAIKEAEKYDKEHSLTKYVDKYAIQEIVVAIEERRGALPINDLLNCKMMGCHITEATTFIERQSGTVNLKNVNPSWMVFSDGFGAAGNFDLIIKRAFDIFTSLLLLIVSLPILIIAGLLVKVTSHGPIFYRQERVGLNGKPFDVLKFRSMATDAEADGVPKWAAKNDSRVTPVGKVIRASRIDEIPQIFNVLKGDMSFVGPRPERPYFVDQLEKNIPFYGERHRVKPGITGWAQLNYPYGASEEDTKHKLEYDLYYIKNYSLLLDFIILVQTVRVVFWPDGVR